MSGQAGSLEDDLVEATRLLGQLSGRLQEQDVSAISVDGPLFDLRTSLQVGVEAAETGAQREVFERALSSVTRLLEWVREVEPGPV